MKKCSRHNHDTYIESVFMKKLECEIRDSNLKRKIKIEWLADKEHYSNLLETVEFEFINYSLHDSSHSISILQNVYLLLGKEKIDRLSVGDLWLLLESAYSHDLGMTTCYKELVDLWKNEDEIEGLIKGISNTDDKEVIKCLKIIKGWINDKSLNLEEINIFTESSCWPLDIRKAVTYINSEYIRSKHAARSRKMIEEYIKVANEKKTEDRLYQCVAIINEMHGCNANRIYDSLEKEAVGFETDIIHPQLIAYLLRVGDVMDIRNNRFEYLNIIYNGGLPPISNNHYQKHKAVTHFYIDAEKVEISINSSDIAVCKNSREWLDLVDGELSNLRENWNSIAPKRLYGLKLTEVNLKVLYKGNLFDADGYNNTLKTDSKKLMDLLSGSNLYNTKLIMFREYIQNAVDATKIELASKLINCSGFLEYISPLKFSECLPEHVCEYLEKSGDDNIQEILRNKIEVFITPSADSKNSFNVKIIDHGIGMDEYGINALFNIGKGWSGRKNIEKVIKSAPNWLKPTGGFGIGFLSGFLLCDKIYIETKSQEGPQYILSLSSPNKGATVEKTINKEYYGSSGTSVSFDIPFYQYYDEIHKYFKDNELTITTDKFSLFDTNDLLRMVTITLDKFIENYIAELFFDITINAPFLEYNKSIGNKPKIFENPKSEDGVDLICWNMAHCTRINENDYYNINQKTCFGFQGFAIIRQNVDDYAEKKEIKDLLAICDSFISTIDIFESTVNETLLLTRDNFHNDFDLKKLIDDILKQYLDKMSELANVNEKAYKNIIKKIKANKNAANNFQLLLFRYIDMILSNIDKYKKVLEGYDSYLYGVFEKIKNYILLIDDKRIFEIIDITNDLYDEFGNVDDLNVKIVNKTISDSEIKEIYARILNKTTLFEKKTSEFDGFMNKIRTDEEYNSIKIIDMVKREVQKIPKSHDDELCGIEKTDEDLKLLKLLNDIGNDIRQQWNGELSIEKDMSYESLIYHLFKEKLVYCISLDNEDIVPNEEEDNTLMEWSKQQELFQVEKSEIDCLCNMIKNIKAETFSHVFDQRKWVITKIYFKENDNETINLVDSLFKDSIIYQEYIDVSDYELFDYDILAVDRILTFNDVNKKFVINPFEKNLDGRQRYSLEYYISKKHVYNSNEDKLYDLLNESERLDLIVNYIVDINHFNVYKQKRVKELYLQLMADVIRKKLNQIPNNK